MSRRVAPARMPLIRYMAKGERGGQGSRTTPVTIEEPVLVATLSDADRAAAVSVLAEILRPGGRRTPAPARSAPDRHLTSPRRRHDPTS